MRNSVDRTLSLFLMLLTVSGYLALATTHLFGVGILVIPAFLFALAPLCQWSDRRSPLYRYVTSAITMAFTLSLPLLFWLIGLLEAIVALIVFIQAHKLLHERERRDYYQAFLMAFFLLVSACSLSPESSIALVLVLFGVSAIGCFMMLHIKSELDQVEDDTSPELATPGEESLLSVPRRTSRVWGAGYLRWGLLVGCGSFVILLAVFLATPRMEAGFLQRESVDISVTGVNEQVQLDFGGAILSDTSVALEVAFPESPDGRYHGPMYWRTITYNGFFGTRWEQVPIRGRVSDRAPEEHYRSESRTHILRNQTGEGPLVRQSIDLLLPARNVLPTLANPVEVRSRDVGIAWDAGRDMGVLLLDSPPSITYDVLSEPPRPDTEALRQITDITRYQWAFDAEEYRLMTYHQLERRVINRVEVLTADIDNLYERARAIEAWLQSDDFEYTLEPPSAHRTHLPVNRFILQTRRGHCELFASAMALMLRSQGIPARVVGGYRGGEWYEDEQVYLVRNSMAHLWVEAYFIDHGWVMFDPSPAVDDPRMRIPWYQGLINLSLRARYFWFRNIVGYRGGLSWEAFRDFPSTLVDRINAPHIDGLHRLINTRGWARLEWALVTAVFGLSAWLILRILRYLRHAKQTSTDLSAHQKRAIRLLRRFRKTLRRHGIASDGKTTEELLANIAPHHATLSEAREIVQTYNAVRFGGASLPYARYVELVRTARRLFASPTP